MKRHARVVAFGMNVKGQVAITPKAPEVPEEMGIYIHVDDVGTSADLFTIAGEMLEALKGAELILEKEFPKGIAAAMLRELIKKAEEKCRS